MAIRALVVAIGTALFIAGGLSPDHAADTRSQVARAATVVKVQQPSGSEQVDTEQGERDSADQPASGAAADRAKQAAERDDDRRNDSGNDD